MIEMQKQNLLQRQSHISKYTSLKIPISNLPIYLKL